MTTDKKMSGPEMDSLAWQKIGDLKEIEGELTEAKIESAETFGVCYYSDDHKTPLYGGMTLVIKKPDGHRIAVQLCPVDMSEALEAHRADLPPKRSRLEEIIDELESELYERDSNL